MIFKLLHFHASSTMLASLDLLPEKADCMRGILYLALLCLLLFFICTNSSFFVLKTGERTMFKYFSFWRMIILTEIVVMTKCSIKGYTCTSYRKGLLLESGKMGLRGGGSRNFISRLCWQRKHDKRTVHMSFHCFKDILPITSVTSLLSKSIMTFVC